MVRGPYLRQQKRGFLTPTSGGASRQTPFRKVRPSRSDEEKAAARYYADCIRLATILEYDGTANRHALEAFLTTSPMGSRFRGPSLTKPWPAMWTV